MVSLDNEPTLPEPEQPSSSSVTTTTPAGDINPLIQSNAVGLFGPGVSEFWATKKKVQAKRVRRGLTQGKKLPENIENLLGKDLSRRL